MSCEHKRTMTLMAKSSDCNFVEVPHLGIEHEGYVPRIAGVGGGDYIKLKVCLDCKQVLGLPSLSDDELTEIIQ